jgi:hypothetical protein
MTSREARVKQDVKWNLALASQSVGFPSLKQLPIATIEFNDNSQVTIADCD